MSQTIVFRVDSSRIIGLGHVMRCLTLANAMRERGDRCVFVMRDHEGNATEIVQRQEHELVMLPRGGTDFACDAVVNLPKHAAWLGVGWGADAQQTLAAISAEFVDWIVIDHYAIDYRWHEALRPRVKNIMAIDDLADRRHDCDLLLDQTFGRDPSDYDRLTPQGCRVLAGSQYALLRPEFAKLRADSLARRKNSKVGRILVSMGGTDPQNVTVDVLAALKLSPLPDNCQIDVVLGAGAPWIDTVRQAAAAMPWRTLVRVDVHDMGQLMSDADLAIGAAGATSWERCCLGLPSIVIVLAENQQMVARTMNEIGAAIALFPDKGLTENLRANVLELVMSDTRRALISQKAATLADGTGAMFVSQCLAGGPVA